MSDVTRILTAFNKATASPRTSYCRWCTTPCGSLPLKSWLTSRRGRRSRRRPSFMRRFCGGSIAIAHNSGTTEGIFSRPRPRRCGGCSWSGSAEAALKRGGGGQRVELEPVDSVVLDDSLDLIALDEALEKLAGEDPLKSELVKLRFFAGLTMPDAARSLGISLTTAEPTLDGGPHMAV